MSNESRRQMMQRHMPLEERRSLRADALHEAVIFHDEEGMSAGSTIKVAEVLNTAEAFFDWLCEPPAAR